MLPVSSNLSSPEPATDIALVVAAATNNTIGKDNQLIWHLPNDLKFFKNTTWGFPVIMGRKSFESVGKALPGRRNIVITRRKDWQAKEVAVTHHLQDAVELAKTTNARQVFIIGGGEIYLQSMDIAHTIYITRVHAILEGDTFFPDIPEAVWELVSEDDFEADEKHAYAYSFQVWKKRTPAASTL